MFFRECIRICGPNDVEVIGTLRHNASMCKHLKKGSKRPPDYSLSDDYQVFLVLDGEVKDPMFLRFIEKTANVMQTHFNVADLVVLDAVHREQAIPANLSHNQV